MSRQSKTGGLRGSEPALIEELEALAARHDHCGGRARIVLALVRGETPAQIVRRTGVTFATIRSARRRFETGGAAALLPKPPARRGAPPPDGEEALKLRSGVPDVLLALEASGGRRGRIPAARLAIETWARDAVALGAVPPGSPFPSRRSVLKAFRTTSAVVQRAFDALARQGFARSAPGGGGSRAADPPPFAGRYLFVGTSDADQMHVGYMEAACAAAARLEKARGVRFEFRSGMALESPSAVRMECLADIRAQRWAGVFFRAWTDAMGAVGPVVIDNAPVCIVRPRGHLQCSFTGSRVAKIESWPGDSILEALLGDCAAAGGRRVAVLDHQDARGPFRAGEVARLAARHGLELGPWHYQAINMVGNTEGTRDAVRAHLTAILAPGRGWSPDCVVLMDDHWIGPLEGALDALGLAPPVVACLGNKPALPATRLDVRFRGLDLEATLSSFIDWCDAVHAGAASAPQPVLATF